MPLRLQLQRPTPVVSASSQAHSGRTALKPDEICVGCVAWLPDLMETSYVRPFRQSDEALQQAGYYHPVVILGIKPQPAPGHLGDLDICFAMVTTFTNLTLSDYAIRRPSLPHSIPIIGTVNPGDSPNLHLERGVVLRKQSYVRLDNVYETNLFSLRSYDPKTDRPAHHWRLDEKSYQKLMSLLLLEPQDYPPTDSVKSLGKSHTARIPICASSPTTAQNPQNAPIPIHAPGPRATQYLHTAHPRHTPGPIATQHLQNAYTPQPASPELVRTTPSVRIQTQQMQYSTPYADSGSAMQLPPPAQYSIRQRKSYGYCLCEWAMAFLFCLCICLLLVACVWWLI